jgi:large subunit ribosomal protein L10
MVPRIMLTHCSGLQDWSKTFKKPEAIGGGVLEGKLYDAKGVNAIGDLPSKQELYAKIAAAINAVPKGLAVTVKQVPEKTARAIKLAFVPDA